MKPSRRHWIAMDGNVCDARFAEVARRSPQAPAVVDRGKVFSFGDIDERSELIARWLSAHGAGPERIVAILVGRGGDVPACVLGVWKSGAAYLALDDETPRARLRSILSQVRPAAVLTQRHLRHRLPAAPTPVLLVDGDIPRRPPGERVRNWPDQLAYVIHTSGSTGTPKCVGVSHRSLLTISDDWQRVYRLGSEATSVLQAAGFGFDVATGDLVRGLLTGACLISCPRETLLSPPDLYLLMHESQAAFAELTPSLLRPLVSYLRATGQRLEFLRCLVTGGERWTNRDYIDTREVMSASARIFNTYGLTETAVDNSYYELDEGALAHDVVPVGREFAGSQIFVLDADLVPATEGEIFIGGPQLARGYLGDPVTTALRFVPAPGGEPGSRLYRTGDLGRRLPTGDLRFLRRADSQLRIRGVRVDPLEIESTLASHPTVSQAAVVARERDGKAELAAYVVPERGAARLSPGELRRFVASRLPAAMVPATITMLEKMPVNQNGKADLSQLPVTEKTDNDPPAGDTSDDPPDGSTGQQRAEAVLLRIWSQLLGQPVSGSDEDFFELGGSSLLAAQFTMQVQAELGTDLPLGTIHQHPTIAELAPIIARASAAERIPADPGRTAGPLSPGQNRLWILHQLDDHLVAYNIAVSIKIIGWLDTQVLSAALDRLVARHAALRTSVTATDGSPVQRITPCDRVSVSELTVADDAAARTASDEFARRPFDLSKPPLLRAALLRLPGHEHRLVLSMHHIVSDGWTAGILLTELGELYSALLAGRAPELPAPEASFLDFATWQAERLRRGDFDAQLASWRARLDKAGGERIRPAATAAGSGPQTYRTGLGCDLASALRDLAREHRTTQFVIMLAAFAELLHRWSGEHDLIIGAPLGDRSFPGIERLAGFFVNTAALRFQLPAEPTFADLIRLGREAVTHAVANQDVPFDVVQKELGRSGTAGLFQAWLNFLGAPDPAPSMAGLDTEMLDPPLAGALFELNMYVTELTDDLRIELVYDSSRWDRPHMTAFIEQYIALLRQSAADPEQPVRLHPLRAETPLRPVPARRHCPSLPALVAGQVHSRPEAVAVRSQAGELSYQQLGAWAAAIAGQLSGHDLDSGRLVAVYAPRSAELVAALLGVLDAGSAFCVLDPAYPPNWLAGQLNAAQPDAVLHIPAAGPLPDVIRAAVPTSLELTSGPRGTAALAGTHEHGTGYVTFTSGTTGQPRAVRGDQIPVVHFLRSYAARFALGPGDRFAMLSGLAHDPLLRDVFAPLFAGATLCVPPAEMIRAPASLRGWLAAEKVTVAHLTPPMIRLLAGSRGPRLPHLRLAMSGGDMLHVADVGMLRDMAPAATVVNAYGTTETPQVMSWETIQPGEWAGPPMGRICVGRGIDGVELLVRGAAGTPQAAVGEIGHIVVRTPYLTEGLGVEYDTSDLGRQLPDGRFELVGRADGQVKIDGFRAELSVLDSHLRQLPYVQDCLTVPRQAADGKACLVSYAVPANGGTVSVARIRADLRAKLPPYLLPAGLVAIGRLPLTPNGKHDRAALPPWTPALTSEASAPPGNTLEKAIAEIWSRALGGQPVSPDASFFEAGGSSMLMIVVQQRIQAELGLDVPVLDLFEYPTVRALAAHLSRPDTGEPAIRSSAPRRAQDYPDSARRMVIRRALGQNQ